MKVLIFTSQIHRLGGAEKLAVELAEGLSSRAGVRVDLLSMGSTDLPGTKETKHRLLRNGVKSVRFLGRAFGTRGQGMLKHVLKLRRILQRGAYDVVETSMPGPTILACLAVFGLRTQLVFGIHDIYRRDHQNSWTYKFLRILVQFNRSVQFYAISKQARQHWLRYARVEPARVRVIYNSIAAEYFEITQDKTGVKPISTISEYDRKVLFVGRLCKRKGLDILIAALGPILEVERVHLFIAGEPNDRPEAFYPGDANLLENLNQQISDNDWSDRVHFLGFRDDIPKIMSSVGVLVHPARKEGFGLVLAEALAAGLPVVATEVGGIPEVLANTDSILVPPDDPEALRNALLKVIYRTPEEADRCRDKGQQRAEYFRRERRIGDMMALFRDLSNLKAKKLL